MNKLKHELAAFHQYLIRLGYHQESAKMLPYCVREFFAYSGKELEAVTEEDISSYHQYLQERPNKRYAGGLSASTIYQHLYSLRLFFTWQLEKGKLQTHPMSRLSFQLPAAKPRQILTQDEIQLLYQACQDSKERALLAVFYGCGLRKSEVEALSIADVDFKSGLLYVRRGKYAKRRAVPMSTKVQADLFRYVSYGRYGKAAEPALFYNAWGRRMRGYSMSRILRKLLTRAKITKTISLHCLRHSIASHLLENGLAVEYVRDFLGHKHLESTQIYTRINQDQLWNLNSI